MKSVGKGYTVISHNIRVELDEFICLKDAIKHIRKYKNRRNTLKLFREHILVLHIVLGKRIR